MHDLNNVISFVHDLGKQFLNIIPLTVMAIKIPFNNSRSRCNKPCYIYDLNQLNLVSI